MNDKQAAANAYESKFTAKHLTSNSKSKNLIAGYAAAAAKISGDSNSLHRQQIAVGVGQKMNIANLSRNDRIPLASSHSYSQNDNFSSRTAIEKVNPNFTRQVVAPIKILENSALKKTRRLRKNFDILAKALKNASTSKKEKPILFSNEISKMHHNASQNVPLQNQNYIIQEGISPSLSKHNRSHIESNIENYYESYTNNMQQPMFKEIKGSCYEVIGGQPSHSQSQRQASKSGTRKVQNQSLYSQISLKEGPSPDIKKGLLSRNTKSSLLYSNLQQNNTQPVMIAKNDQRQFLKVNDKLMRKYVAVSSNNPSVDDNSRNSSQAVLNISTAQDINIYNNSFIVNTSVKKQPQSQNQSRSNSLKRNQQLPKQIKFLINKQQGFEKTVRSYSQHSRGQDSNIDNISNRQLSQYQEIAQAYTTNLSKNNSTTQSNWKYQLHSNLQGSSERNFKQNRISSNVLGNSYQNQIQDIASQSIRSTNRSGQIRVTSKSSQRRNLQGRSQNFENSQEYKNQIVNNEALLRKQLAQSKVLLTQGKQKLQQKDYQSAVSQFTESIKLDPSNMEAKFYRAVSQLDLGQLDVAIQELQEILQVSPSHSQLTHILLSIAYKRTNEMEKALNILTDCVQKHPDYPDVFLARGQAYLISEKFQLSLEDFTVYTKLAPNNGIGFIGMADSYKALEQNAESIQGYTKAIQLLAKLSDDQSQIHLLQAYMKRGLVFFHVRKMREALKDFQYVIQRDHTVVKAHFYIGKIISRGLVKDNTKQEDAILHFEQVVKYHSNELYAGNALFEIAKLRLKEKDFYEAYFNLKRALDSNFSSKRLQLYKDFTEGVLYLIKRKIKKGVQILSDLLEVLINNKEQKDKKVMEYLKHQVYVYRAYGYVAIEKYEAAIDDINRAKKIAKIDTASKYNKLLGKGILRMDHEDFIMATKYFNKASQKFSSNKDTYCLYVISIVRSYSYSLDGYNIDQEGKKEKLWGVKEFMDRAITNCNKTREPSLYFFRGLLFFQLHMFYEALQDFNQAIDEEEEPTASYYLARGRCYACLSILTEAMKDLSIALNLDDTLQEAYIFRGKCAYLLGDNNLAFLDFQRLILTDPKNPIVHVYAGNLLMTTGAYQDAIKAFLNADTVRPTAVAAFQRARCYCALTDLDNAQIELNMALNLCQNDSLAILDNEAINQVQIVSKIQDTKSANSIQILDKAIKSIQSIIEVYEAGDIKKLLKKDSPLNIQIIPNVRRIKLEKVIVAKQLISQHSEMKEFLSLSIDASQSIDLDQMKDIPLFNYYYESIFSIEDFYLFRAVFYFYKSDYLNALHGFELCQQTKFDENPQKQNSPDKSTDSLQVYNQSRNSTPMLSAHSSKTDLSDVGLCSLNVHETNYNILLCYIQMSDYSKALNKVNEIIHMAPHKYQKHFYLIRGLIFEQIKESEKSKNDLQKFQKYNSADYDAFFKNKKSIVFEPFPQKNRLCNLFGNISIKISKNCPDLIAKLSFSMPFIKPPNMIPCIDENAIQEEFNLKQIDAPMPEAPWIRRCQHGIKFTDNMQDEDVDINTDENEVQNSGSSKQVLNSKKQEQKNDTQIDKLSLQPYTQSDVPLTSRKKHLSEFILQKAMVYLVDQEEEMSDKQRISLFDDSKFEDVTMEMRCADEDHNGEYGDEDDDDDDSSEEEDEGHHIMMAQGERESMVLMGDRVETLGKRKQAKYSGILRSREDGGSNPLSDDNEEKQRILSDLNSEIEGDNQDIEDDEDKESLFRSRQSSHR